MNLHPKLDHDKNVLNSDLRENFKTIFLIRNN